jgi:hypothetical protein
MPNDSLYDDSEAKEIMEHYEELRYLNPEKYERLKDIVAQIRFMKHNMNELRQQMDECINTGIDAYCQASEKMRLEILRQLHESLPPEEVSRFLDALEKRLSS